MLDDKYRIERLLATGGMGAVYVGTHVGLRKRVAIKILNPHLNSASMIERFHREAVTASQIGHEGIAQVTDLGTSSEGASFLVMEYLEGESLASRLRTVSPLAIDDACELGCAILSPLAAAHRAGIVHRDLKPDNVFLVRLSRGEMVKLLDFGISRTAGQESSFRLTTTGLVLGTPYYMSPEQARGESVVTPAADLYAFGVILYEMLCGDVPVRADNYNALMYRVTIGDFDPPRARRPEIPEALEQVILHAMARTAAERPASAADLEQALLPFCGAAFRTAASDGIAAPLQTGRYGQHRARDSSPSSPGAFGGPTLSDGSPEPRTPTGSRAAGAPPPAGARPIDEQATTEVNVRESSRSAPQPLPAASAPLAVPRSRTRRIVLVVALCAVAAGAAVTFAFALTRTAEPSRAAVVPATTSMPAATQAPAAPPPAEARPASGVTAVADLPPAGGEAAPATITVKLAIDPASAAVTLDGAAVAGNELTLPRDGALHRLRITAAGYQGYDESLRFDESQRLVVALKRTVVPGRPRPPRKDREPSGIDSESPYH
jgi:eukaryotic-like serine/threonine-protein kinase